jgi:PAS domain S-box-containing protein
MPGCSDEAARSAGAWHGSLERYAVAIGILAVAVALKSMPPPLGPVRSFLLLNGAVVLAAWYGGRGPAVVAIVLAVVAAHGLYLEPYSTFWIVKAGTPQLCLFLIESSFAATLTVATKEARLRAELLARRSAAHERALLWCNRAHTALSLSNEALVRAEDEGVLLEEICRAVVDAAGYRMCWVGRAEQNEAKTVRPIARAGFDEGYVDDAEVTWADAPRGRGPLGTAIRTGRPYVRQDIATHPAFTPWREEARRRGYASVVALPIRLCGKVFGALGIYAAEQDAFDAEAVRLLIDLANDLSYGITALRLRACIGAERARFESVIMQAPIAVAVFSGGKRTVRVANPRWLRLGITAGAPTGRPLSMLVPEPGAEGMLARLARMCEQSAPEEATEERLDLRHPDGTLETRFYNVASEPLRGSEGTVTDVVVALCDVTEQVTARRALEEARAAAEQASRAKDEFLRIASHELRTPLTPILAWAQSLKNGRGRDPAQLDRGLDIILAGARAEARLVDDLLDVSEILAGRMILDHRPLDLGAVVEAGVGEHRPAAAAKGIVIEVVPTADARIIGDAARVRQVVWNLLSNALKFTPRGGRVHVEITREHGATTLRVSDTGKGISEAQRARLFEPLDTGDASLTRAEGGLGLGLFIVRSIVEAHGGTVRVESPGPGLGATFVAELEPRSS